MQDGTEGCTTVRDAWTITAAQRSQREHLSATRKLQHQRMFLAQQGGQLGDIFVSRVVGATTLGRSVACKTFQRFRIRFELNAFLVEREC